MMAPIIRYPTGPVTPHGAYHILHDRIPQMALRSFDDEIVFNLLGGLAIADRQNPERVQVKEIKGLIPPWRTIDQKGATQDGTTFVDALYDPTEVIIEAEAIGRDPAHTRRVARHLYDSLDVKRESELSWFTHDMGRWWAPVRWFKAPDDPVGGISNKRQRLSLRLRADNAFWQSYPSVDDFVFTYATASDDFSVDDVDDVPGFTLAYTVAGTGFVHTGGGQAGSTLNGGRKVVARKDGYLSTTDNQVSEIVIGTLGQWFHPTDAGDDAWARLNNVGTPGDSGVRLAIRRHHMELSYYTAGVKTVIRQKSVIIPPRPGERWRLIAGNESGPRIFTVMRNGATVWTVKEAGTGSPVGVNNRAAGWGMAADGTQEPPALRYWGAGDNATVSQWGFINLYNAGDQDGWQTYTCYGPGLFKFWNGPNATTNEYVQFGPLLPGQIMHVRTDPRRRGVVDMTSTPPTPQHLTQFQKALKDFLSFATGSNATPLAQEIESIFGIKPPQGNPYAMLKGRFSKPIPAKSSGRPAQPYGIKVAIDNGNADSKIISALTPLRRMPY